MIEAIIPHLLSIDPCIEVLDISEEYPAYDEYFIFEIFSNINCSLRKRGNKYSGEVARLTVGEFNSVIDLLIAMINNISNFIHSRLEKIKSEVETDVCSTEEN